MESDPFFLDWGSSVNVNEDLRRAIQSEITVIDNDVLGLDSSIKAENKTSSHLARDLNHARSELVNLNRGAADDKDNAAMNEQIQMRLRDSLSTEIVEVISPPSSRTGDCASRHNVDNQNPTSASAGMADDVLRCAQSIKHLKSSVQTKKANLHESKVKFTELNYQLNAVNNRIVRENKNQNTWNDDVEAKRGENDAEKRRVQSAKESLYRARKNTGEYTQQYTNDLKILASTKKVHSEEEAKCNAELAATNDCISQLSSQASSLSSSYTEISEQISKLNKQFAKREEIHAERQVLMKDLKEAEKQTQAHKAKEEELLKLLTKLKEEVSSDEREYDLIKKKKAQLDLICAANEREENEHVKPAREQLPKMLEEGEVLAKEISILQEQAASSKQSLENWQAKNQVILEGINIQVIERNTCIMEKNECISKLQQTRDELNKSALDEINQHENLEMKFADARKAQTAIVDVLMRQREKKKVDAEEARKLESIAETVKLEKLTCGVQIISEAKRLEHEYENKCIA